GYTASAGDNLIRRELSSEAIRLSRTLCDLLPEYPENTGLLALMILHNSRRDARVNSEGELVPLEEQDRSLWYADEIAEGARLVEKALRQGSVGFYQLQAAIAALHAQAKTSHDTDWKQIAALYQLMMRIHPSPIVALNRAVAVALSETLETGLALMNEVGSSGELDSYHLYYAARADIIRRMNRRTEAAEDYSLVLNLTSNHVEQEI